MADRQQTAIAIFAKAPIAGFAKTRLIPRLGAPGAARFQHQMIEKTLHTAQAAAIGPVSLWCTPSVHEPAFQALAEHNGVSLCTQPNTDLGQRMAHAFAAITPELPILLVGTDCPALTAHHFVLCARALKNGADAVFIPVEDGGYILIGLKRSVPALFQDMAWGSAQVMAATRARARALGLKWLEMPPLWDIDVEEDYDRALALGLIAPDADAHASVSEQGGMVS
ncbi:MAG: TIGR04282 family arsenosugar biosynthesis glycosyltransferase [Rhizomicrobium sp.]